METRFDGSGGNCIFFAIQKANSHWTSRSHRPIFTTERLQSASLNIFWHPTRRHSNPPIISWTQVMITTTFTGISSIVSRQSPSSPIIQEGARLHLWDLVKIFIQSAPPDINLYTGEKTIVI